MPDPLTTQHEFVSLSGSKVVIISTINGELAEMELRFDPSLLRPIDGRTYASMFFTVGDLRVLFKVIEDFMP